MIEVPDVPVVVVRPGKLFASREPVWMRTLLGSCVSLCLCDRLGGIAGMNHFLLPGKGCTRNPDLPAQYGIHAMELLMKSICHLGGDRRRLEAMAFGGADVLAVSHSGLSVAQANVAFLREFLDAERIPLVKCQLGGVHAMRVALFSATCEVSVERVSRGAAQQMTVGGLL